MPLNLCRSATVVCAHLTLQYLCSARDLWCHYLQMPPTTHLPNSTRVLRISSLYEHRHPKVSGLHPHLMWLRISQVKKRFQTRQMFLTPWLLYDATAISLLAPTIDEYDVSEAFLNETATTITVLLKPAQAKGAPIRYHFHTCCISCFCHMSIKKNYTVNITVITFFFSVYSAYQIVVEEVNPQRSRRQASSDCYEVTDIHLCLDLTNHICIYLCASERYVELITRKLNLNLRQFCSSKADPFALFIIWSTTLWWKCLYSCIN